MRILASAQSVRYLLRQHLLLRRGKATRVPLLNDYDPNVRFTVCPHKQPCTRADDDILNLRTMAHAVAVARRVVSPTLSVTILRNFDGRRWYVCSWHWDQILYDIHAEELLDEAQVAYILNAN